MKVLVLCCLWCGSVGAQFISPSWRGDSDAEYAAWDMFTEAEFAPNVPDKHSDAPTSDAALTCFTGSAFLTSSGNIYSFQSATSFQIEDSANFPIENALLQISGLGSGINLETVRLIANDPEGAPQTFRPARSFIINKEVLTGERGGEGTSYAIQWDLSANPVVGSYAVLFKATESSLSLDKVSLDTSASFQAVLQPQPMRVRIEPKIDGFTVSWTGRGQLETSATLSGNWVSVSEGITTTEGVHQLVVSKPTGRQFFRLTQPSVTE